MKELGLKVLFNNCKNIRNNCVLSMYIIRSSNYSGLKSNAHFQINRKLVLHNNIFHEIITDHGQILKKTQTGYIQ